MSKYTEGPFFYDEQTESVGCPAGWLLRIDHTSKGDGKFGNQDDDGKLIAKLLNTHFAAIVPLESAGEVMCPTHPRWKEFTNRLAGPKGCHLQGTEKLRRNRPSYPNYSWVCSGKLERPLATAILEDMGMDVTASLVYFYECGGHCDCEILFNVTD